MILHLLDEAYSWVLFWGYHDEDCSSDFFLCIFDTDK